MASRSAKRKIPKGRRIRRRRASPARQISRVLFAVIAVGLIVFPAYQAGGVPRVYTMCEYSAPMSLWLKTAFGPQIAVYGLLTTVGAGMFLRPKILQSSILSMMTAVGVEGMEAMYAQDSLCRVRDFVPAMLGIGLAVAVHTAMRSATPKVVKVKKRR